MEKIHETCMVSLFSAYFPPMTFALLHAPVMWHYSVKNLTHGGCHSLTHSKDYAQVKAVSSLLKSLKQY